MNITPCNMCMIEASDCRELVQYRLPKPDNTWAGLTFPDGHVKLGESVMFATIHKVSKRRLASRSQAFATIDSGYGRMVRGNHCISSFIQ